VKERGKKSSRDSPREGTYTEDKRPIDRSDAASGGRCHVTIGESVRVKIDHEVTSRQRVLEEVMRVRWGVGGRTGRSCLLAKVMNGVWDFMRDSSSNNRSAWVHGGGEEGEVVRGKATEGILGFLQATQIRRVHDIDHSVSLGVILLPHGSHPSLKEVSIRRQR
jgi:hypothetical protein